MNEESKHYKKLWDRVIKPAGEVVFREIGDEFKEQCAVEWKAEYKGILEKEYRRLREHLKKVCYKEASEDGSLDLRKLAAIFCVATIHKKCFKFDVDAAYDLEKEIKKEKKATEFNLWAVDNLLMNYKFAYYVGLNLIYFSLAERLLTSSNDVEKKMGHKLSKMQHLARYPVPKVEPAVDGFDVSIILGLADADINNRELDPFMLAMQFYQIEMYTEACLRFEVRDDNTNSTKR